MGGGRAHKTIWKVFAHRGMGYFAAALSAVTKADGEPQVRTLDVKAGSTDADWQLRRDWAASSAGASIADFTGTDNTQYGCGPDGLIDGSSAVWGSDAKGGTNGTGVDPVHNTVKLPQAVDIGELLIDPTAGCGDDTTASLGDYRIDTSPDGTTWTTAAEGHFKPADTGRQNAVTLKDGTGQNVQYVRLTMLGNQAADNGVDCAKDSGPSAMKRPIDVGVNKTYASTRNRCRRRPCDRLITAAP